MRISTVGFITVASDGEAGARLPVASTSNVAGVGAATAAHSCGPVEGNAANACLEARPGPGPGPPGAISEHTPYSMMLQLNGAIQVGANPLATGYLI